MKTRISPRDIKKGTPFHDWTVVSYAGKGKMLCECKCGKHGLVRARALLGGTSLRCKSCGAKQRAKINVACVDCSTVFKGTPISVRCNKCKRKLDARIAAKWRKEHPEEAKRISNGYYHRTKDRPESLARLRNKNLAIYGLTIERYEAILASQGGVCAICQEVEPGKTPLGKDKKLAVDHDHDTGEVRGLLCSRCNQAIGGMREDERLIKRMIKYLRHHKRK